MPPLLEKTNPGGEMALEAGAASILEGASVRVPVPGIPGRAAVQLPAVAAFAVGQVRAVATEGVDWLVLFLEWAGWRTADRRVRYPCGSECHRCCSARWNFL